MVLSILKIVLLDGKSSEVMCRIERSHKIPNHFLLCFSNKEENRKNMYSFYVVR